VDVLRHAAQIGDLTAADVTELLEPFFDCLAQCGWVGDVTGTMEVGPALKLPNCDVAMPGVDISTEEKALAVDAKVDACQDTYMGCAWKAIQLAPTTVEAWDADVTARTPAVAVVETGGERCMSAH